MHAMRRILQLTTVVISLGTLVPVCAQTGAKLEGQLVFGGAGGSPQDVFRKDLIPLFEQRTGVKVTYVAATLEQHYANIAAQPNNPEFDAVWSVFTTHEWGKASGVFARLDEASVPNLKDIYPAFRKDPFGVVSSNSAVGIEYNPKFFAEAGIPAPQSWKDLWDPRLKGRVGVWNVSIVSYGGTFVPFTGRLFGSGEGDYATAYTKIKELLGPSTPLLGAPATVEPLLSQGAIWVTHNSDARTFQAKAKGLPVEFVVPKEGAIGIFNFYDVLVRAKNPNAARAFVNFLISAEAQQIFAIKLAIGPTNSKVKLPPEVSAMLVDSPEKLKNLWIPDYAKLVADMPKITKEFNAQIAR